MATYTPTQGATLLQSGSTGAAPLVSRVEIALLQKAAAVAGTAVGAEWAYILRLKTNPAGEANAALPLVLAIVNVATPGVDPAAIAPLDSEINAAVNTLWATLIK